KMNFFDFSHGLSTWESTLERTERSEIACRRQPVGQRRRAQANTFRRKPEGPRWWSRCWRWPVSLGEPRRRTVKFFFAWRGCPRYGAELVGKPQRSRFRGTDARLDCPQLM